MLTTPAAREPEYGKKEVKFLGEHYSYEVNKGDLTRRVRLEWKSHAANPSLDPDSASDSEVDT